MNDIKFFDNEQGFIDYVKILPIDKVKKRCMIEHELAHGRKAIELGYSVRYGVEERSFGNSRQFRGVFELEPEASDEEHIRQILSAPSELSEGDKSHLEELAKESGGQR